ncbi:MAG: Peptidoglycan D,D-transpeptidase MrdA [Chlamydiae bacterium]|nr:Peptidoglycan D,D-transpeptidase MrdA [Chlamydiota bacterium]
MQLRRRYKSKTVKTLDIPAKSNQILNLIFFVMLLITFRIWQLCVIDHEDKVHEALKPQQKVFVQPANRGGIYDRFGEPLAVNKIQYQASVFYSPIRQIPTVRWKRNKKGKKLKSYPRRQYIEKLSNKLSEILYIDAHRIEDLIHAKASIRFDTPFVLKEGISEEQYYQLKMLEGSWPGVYAGIESKRNYPQKKVAGNVVGYMGAINRGEYDGVVEERLELEKFLNDWQMGYFPPLPKGLQSVTCVRERLKKLKERSYSIYDWVGKSGVEASFDEALRGYTGRQFFYSDAKGQFLKPLALSQKSFSGKKLTLTISSELQKYAEELLIENERVRRSIYINPANGAFSYQKEPWIKGGAIVALDPSSGEVLAMASYPRFDPNDFILSGDEHQKEEHAKNISKWLESENFISNVWDGQVSLSKEIYDRRQRAVVEDKFPLTWELFLNLILPVESPVTEALSQIKSVKEAVLLQEAFAKIFEISNTRHPFHLLKVLYKEPKYSPYPKAAVPQRITSSIEKNLREQNDEYIVNKKILDKYLSMVNSNYDQLLLLDLCRLSIDSERVPEELLPLLGQVTLSEHRKLEGAYISVEAAVKGMSKELFRKYHFRYWRKKNQKKFLKEKRKEELASKSYPKPYIDYLDKEEKVQFEEFWEEYKHFFIKSFLTAKVDFEQSPTLIPYFNHFALWGKEIKNGAHQSVGWFSHYQVIENLFSKGSEEQALQYLTILRKFSDLNRPLYGRYRKINKKKPTEKDLAKSFYPQYGFSYSRSYAFSQATPQGSLFKLVTAYEALRQRYHQNPNLSVTQLNPLTIIDDLHLNKENHRKWNVGYLPSGKPIPQAYKGGRLPRSHRRAIGSIDLKGALVVSSNCYFAMLAADILKHPDDLNSAARLFSFGSKTGLDLPGEIAGRLPKDLNHNTTGLYAYSIGQHTLVVTPIQTALMMAAIANKGTILKPQIVKSIEGIELKQFNAATLQKDQFDFKNTLSHIGIDFPLFTCKERGEIKHEEQYQHEVNRHIEMPSKIQQYLFSSMHEIVQGKRGSASPNRVRNYSPSHSNYRAYQELKNQIIGKTSSAEIREAVDLDLKKGVNTYKHTWFGGIVFEEDIQENTWPKPELVVVVYLRYSDFGREAAPLVASLTKKWREIKKKHQE